MRRSIAALLATTIFVGVAHAGDKPIYAAAPDWVQPAPPIDVSHLGDADPVLLVMDQQQRLQDGQVWAYTDMAMRIASPAVLTQAGTLPLPWDPSKGDIIIHRVEILRGTEHIDVLASGDRFKVLQREQQLERATLNGLLTATLAVEGLRVGDVLHLSFSITHKDPALHGHVQNTSLLVPEPARLQFGRIRTLWPQSMDLKTRTYIKGIELKPVDRADGFHELSFTLPVAKPAEMPGDAPGRFQPLPIFDMTNYGDWSEVSKDMAPLFATDGAIAPGSPLAAEAAKIAAASSDPRTRAALALQLVQDKVRYLYKGMDGGNYVPQAPAQTWSARYGDCKAKSLLLLSILRELGIEAEPVLVSADLGDLLAVRLPMPGAFNHMIVRATIGGESLWLDGTGSGARLSDLGDVPPFRHALPLRVGGAGLMDMPMRPNARPMNDAEIDIDATAGLLLPMPYTARITVLGATAEVMRVVSIQSGKEDTDAAIDRLLTGLLGANEAVGRSFKYDEATASATIAAHGIAYPEWSKQDERLTVTLDSTVNAIDFTPDRARSAWRDIPVASGGYDDSRVLVRTHLPDGGKGFTLSGATTLPRSLGGKLLTRSAALGPDGVITVDDRVVSGLIETAPADISATRAQVAQAKTQLLKAIAPADRPTLLAEADAAKRSKRLAPILAVYAQQIAEKPDDVESYTDRAWLFERIYDRAGAIKDLTKAVELAPSVDIYLRRARQYRALNDDVRALADAQAAVALDPSASGAIGMVAALEAEHGKRDAAIDSLAEHVAAGGDEKTTYVIAQADLLAGGERTDEALSLLDGVIAKSPGNAGLMNSRCWIKGTRNVALDTALKDCTKAIELSESPASALDSRALVYFRMNRMDDAVADLNAALDYDSEQAASLFMRGVIRKRTGAPGADADLAAARTIWPRVDEDYDRYGIKP
ncbi:DUF3857 domain-containing protein [Sphingomonas sp. dw_22]|uniref:DUF3857 domain-containing protein n=1 Tax=Sphingomonas sp. dw_22 TaxID=2721175 RepID=UPI001BD1F70D|nr:DUF3857 domain-containing protein [Sphingomonas sp. dw_22]